MNKNVFRLLYSQHLAMFIPAPETASGNAGRASSNQASGPIGLLAAIIASSLALTASLSMAEPLDGLVPGGGSWVGAHVPVIKDAVMNINQTESKAILNWQQLNLRAGETLNFNQENASWSALNRINSIDPSNIAGNVNALGHVYFINANGIIFGNGAQINVGSLTASSLDIKDELFKSGVVSDRANPSFIGKTGFVRTEAGAYLNANADGRIMLLAPNVKNAGVINTPEGQTILAAGQAVYLAASSDPAGLLVEVSAGGTATNLGDIVSKLGNVTLVGLAVNQEGRISASTSVRANGSIHLLANTKTLNTVDRDGVVNIAQGSKTNIEVEVSDKEEVLDSQLVRQSRVQIEGKRVVINGEVIAHGGLVLVNPLNAELINPPPIAVQRETLPDTRIYIGPYAFIDVSGIDAIAPMSRNQLSVQLFSDQLKDTPILRGGPVFGQTIYVDARNLSSKQAENLIDFQPALALKTKTIAERFSQGGSVTINASPLDVNASPFSADGGEILFADGSIVDVSGGSITYQAGYLRESNLLFNGQLISISKANRNTPYQAITDNYTIEDTKWNQVRSWSLNSYSSQGEFVSEYTDGKSAGDISILGKNFVIGADFRAYTITGTTQRSNPPLAGSFSLVQSNIGFIGSPLIRFVAQKNLSLPVGFSVLGSFDEDASIYQQGDNLSTDLKLETQISTNIFNHGFQKVKVIGGISPVNPYPALPTYSSIIVDSEINGIADGELMLKSYSKVDLNASINVPSGNITIEADGVSVSSDVSLNTEGLYANDKPHVVGALLGSLAKDGGSITIKSKDINGDVVNPIILAKGTHFNAGAGAWIDATGRLNQGIAGNISMSGLNAFDAVKFESFGFDKGGILALDILGDVIIGGSKVSSGSSQWLSESFFNEGGFSKYNIKASSWTNGYDASILADPDLVVQAGVTINPKMQTLFLRSEANSLPSGSPIKNIAYPLLKAPSFRSPVSLSLSAFDELIISPGASIKIEPPSSGSMLGGVVELKSQRQLTVLGSVIVPAGEINANVILPNDEVINNSLSLYVGPEAILSATGYYTQLPANANGQKEALLLGAGKITLESNTLAVLMQGSLLDVSGVSGEADLLVNGTLNRDTIYGAAGSISIKAPFVLDGSLMGSANGTGAGGSLSLTMLSDKRVDFTGVPISPGQFIFNQYKNLILAQALRPGDIYHNSLVNINEIAASQITAGGFDRLSVSIQRGRADDQIIFNSGIDLILPVSISLNAPRLTVTGDGAAKISASDIGLNSVFGQGISPSISSGFATLQLSANFIDLRGKNIVSGVARMELIANNDIRVRGMLGSLTTSGELLLRAREIYPSTLTNFTFEAKDVDSNPLTRSSIKIESNGLAPKPILSAKGNLILKADNIEQAGVLLAPLGTITLDGQSITLLPGSITSVSAIAPDGSPQLIPFGITGLSGLNFIEPFGKKINDSVKPNETIAADNSLVNGKVVSGEEFAKKITLDANKILVLDGAKIDIAGGGDTMSFEFVNGVGGSIDTLGQNDVYAILPSLLGEYAPYDDSYQNSSNGLMLGDAVYIKGALGLKEGIYPLLPARYALLPGAFMLQASSTTVANGGGLVNLDGSVLISGYRTTLDGTSRDAVNGTFKLTDGAIFRTNAGNKDYKGPAEYLLNTGDNLHTNLAKNNNIQTPRLAADAGQLSIKAGGEFSFEGNLNSTTNGVGLGSFVDIESDNLKIVSSLGSIESGTSQLTVSSLMKLKTESLLLGGTRIIKAGTQSINTTAAKVIFANDADDPLNFSEIIVSAKNEIVLEGASNIQVTKSKTFFGSSIIKASGDGVILAASSLNDLTFYRESSSGLTGTLKVSEQSTLNVGRSLVIDSTKRITDLGTTEFDLPVGAITVGQKNAAIANGSVTLGADLIQLGSPIAVAKTGTLFSNDLINSFGNISSLSLNSKQNIEIHGTSSFGSDSLNLTLNTSGVKGLLENGQSASLTAGTLVLKNASGNNLTAAAKGFGTLDMVASTVLIEGRDLTASGTPVFGIGGFDTVNLYAINGDLTFKGVGASTINANTTNIFSSRVTATSASLNTLTSSDVMNIKASPSLSASSKDSAVIGLGANLKIEAKVLDIDGVIDLPSGQFTGLANSGDLTVSANIKVASAAFKFDEIHTTYSPGGTIILRSSLGNVWVKSSATIDVGSDLLSSLSDADAGTLSISAISDNKSVNVEGQLFGSAGKSGGIGGRFVVDADQIDAFSSLNNKLNVGGFTTSRDIRIRNSSNAAFTISGTDAAIKAEQISLTLDKGDLIVNGEVNAIAAKNSRIGIYVKDSFTLGNGASLSAVNTNIGAEGGEVEIASSGTTVNSTATESSVSNLTTGGGIDIQAGSFINVAGGSAGVGGKIKLRAPRVGSGLGVAGNDDINIKALAGTISGASKVQAEGFKVYSDSAIKTADISTSGALTTWYKEAETFMKSVADDDGVGLKRLIKFNDPIFSIVPGLEIRNADGNITLSNDWTLHNWRFDPNDGVANVSLNQLATGLDVDGNELLAGVLTIRAAGNLDLSGTLSDGFKSATLVRAGEAQGVRAWSYNLVAGADMNSANFMSTNQLGTGTFAFKSTNKVVRTGAGDIRIETGGDLTMFDSTSAIYTAGRRASETSGFAFYGVDGGDLDIKVLGNINGKTYDQDKQQTINEWLYHQGGVTYDRSGSVRTESNVQWWIRPELFMQGVATFGGGNVNVSAGGNITTFSAAAATTAKYLSDTNFIVYGGGDVKVTAGKSILSGVYYAGRGDVRIDSGESIKASNSAFGTSIALQDGSVKVSANSDLNIESVFNPTAWTSNAATFDSRFSFFLTFNTNSTLAISSLTGNINVGNQGASTLLSKSNFSSNGEAAYVFPGSIDATAYVGSINASNITMIPTAKGNLSLLASKNVTVTNLFMSDADSDLLPTATVLAKKLDNNPADMATNKGPNLDIYQPLITSHASIPVHQSDTETVNIVSREQSVSIIGDSTSFFAKPVYIHAAQDINFSAGIQHSTKADMSVIDAGRDFSIGVGTDTINLEISGPGELLVQAGRNISLGKTEGIVSIGNINNPNLSEKGAAITLIAGQGAQAADLDSYIQTYLNPDGTGPIILSADPVKLDAYRQNTTKAVTSFTQEGTNKNNLSDRDAFSIYLESSKYRQSIFAYRHLSSELLEAAYTGKVQRGDDAIATLFPSGRKYDGDILLFQSQIKTKNNSTIDMIAPGGFINVGVPVSSGEKIGVITESGGAIRAFSESGFQVEQSKVITQYGSDITVWVNNGNIDAGRGSKSSVAAPTKEISTDNDGVTKKLTKGSAVGSGIRADTYDIDGPNKSTYTAPKEGSVALITPRGILDLGEAGILGGDILLLNLGTVGLGGISSTGSVTGAPTTNTSSVAGTMTGVSNAAADATKSIANDITRQATANATVKKPMPSLISVEVIGLGD
jgi:filamentous hemagglutinin